MTNTPTHELTMTNGAKLLAMTTPYGYWVPDHNNYVDARGIRSVKAL